MKTDWKALKGKTILVAYIKKDYFLFKTYSYDKIVEYVVADVSPSGRLFKESGTCPWWIDTKRFKLLDVL